MDFDFRTKLDDSKINIENYWLTFIYRGKEVDIFVDDPGQQYYINYNGKEISLGAYNIDYADEIMSIIDDDLDTIAINWNEDYSGAKLEWFDNGGYRDIRLVYRFRTVYIWPCNQKYVDEFSEETKELLIKQAEIRLYDLFKYKHGAVYDIQDSLTSNEIKKFRENF